MRRGRLFIYLALILIIGIAALVIYMRNKGIIGGAGAKPTPAPRLVDIVIAGQNIAAGTQITGEMLDTMKIPEDQFVSVLFRDQNVVIDQYAKYTIDPGVPITSSMLSTIPVIAPEGRGIWIYQIPSGMTAISIPITRLSAVGFAPRVGDRVNLIASFLIVDVDTNFQSLLPNSTAGVLAANGRSVLVSVVSEEEVAAGLESKDTILNLAAQSVSGLYLSPQGRVEFDTNLQVPFYIVPSELQRPRLVTQMVMQDVQVLKVGTFPLPEEEEKTPQAQAVATGTPTVQQPGAAGATETIIRYPDIITLVVTPQDAVTLTYLLYSKVQITLTLRGPGDTSRVETEAVTLQYLLSQANIPIPAKLPYAMEPNVYELTQPYLPNDIIVATPEE